MLLHPAVVHIAAATLDRPRARRCHCWLAVGIAAILCLIGLTVRL